MKLHGLSKMIFSKLFQPKYKHKDALVRIQAIEALEPSQSQDKSILHELAFNDADARVALAALNRLNNFDLWWKMADTAKDERIARHARNKVEATLLGEEDIPLQDSTRRTFIKECRQAPLLEKLLQKNALDEQDTELMVCVLNKLNKPQVSLRYLLNTANKELQQSLFDAVREEPELQKIIKKSEDSTLVEKAQARLDAIAEEREKPLKLAKETTLILSKLLALLDEADFEIFVSQRKELEDQFQQQQAQFLILEEDDRNTYNEKFESIQNRLNKKVSALQSDWDAQQELERTSQALKEAKSTCHEVLDKVGEALTSEVESITLGQLETFNQDIQHAETKLNKMLEANLSEAEFRGIEHLVNRLLASRTSLESLPALQTAIQQGKDLLLQFRELPLPDDSSQVEAAGEYLDDMKLRWKELTAPYEAIWPSNLQQQWQAQVKEWHKSLKHIRDSMQNAVTSVRRRLNGIDKAVDHGRFRNAIRNYEHVKKDYLALPEQYQARLSRQFEKVKNQIENLKDWQAYIAMPRKPEILKDIEQLVFNPLEPKQQADRVKELRREWNSLGKVENEADEAMNHAFDLACEEAFKPCREYYAELEQEREKNLQIKQKLLQEISDLADGDVVHLAKALRDMQQQWRNVGGVDYKQLDSLNEQYQSVVNPIKDKVSAFYQQNAEAKQNLLRQAEALLQLDNWREATDAAKKLQEQWRQVEFAGQKLENRLWSDFRKMNDKIFAKREQALSEQQDALQEEIRIQVDAVTAVESTITSSSSRAELTDILNNVIKPALNKLSQLPKKSADKAIQEINGLRRKLEEKLLYLDDSERNAQYEAVFEVLDKWRTATLPEEASELPNSWRQAFYTTNVDESVLAELSRQQITLLLEAQCQIDSPAAEESLKKASQLKMMALKLQEGTHLDNDELLLEWIQRGPLEPEDVAQLPRLKRCFQ
ncbi:MAG: DUF349 domain-containing protein [Aestuariibacter sp.]